MMDHTVSGVTVRRHKHAGWPLLVFLLVISYGLLTTVVVLQDRTIDAQADLIHLLFKAVRPLNVKAPQKNQLLADKQPASKRSYNQLPSSQVPRIQAPSTQVPLDQHASQIPSSQEKPQVSAKPGRNRHKAGRRSPFRPPAEVTDPSDMRRTVFSI